MRIMVIAPHPDDEIIGCGGVLAGLHEEIETAVVYVTDQPTGSEEESLLALNALGIRKRHSTIWRHFAEVTLNTLPSHLICGMLIEEVSEFKPDIFFIPPMGENEDHRVVHQAALVAAQPHRCPSLREVYAYEVTPGSKFRPNTFFDITESMQAKIDAMRCYKSQAKPWPHPRSEEALLRMAQFRGSESGYDFAEAFELIRRRGALT